MRFRAGIGSLIPPVLVAIALAMMASGCGSSASVALDPVAQAADVTSNAGGAHMSLTAQVSNGALPAPITISGEGFFNYKSREGALSLDMSGLPAAALASTSGPLRLEEIFKSSTIYVGSSLFAGKLPGGARWMKLDLSRLGGGLGFNLQQLAGGQSNPAQLLDYLKAGGSVTVVGHELVRGAATTHYHGSVDLKRIADFVPSASRAQVHAAIGKLIAQTGVGSLPVDVWVDAHRLVRRMTIALSLPSEGQKMQLHITIELFGFGATATVTTPPAAETYDATSTALAGLGASGG
jgi:hypothetical protein